MKIIQQITKRTTLSEQQAWWLLEFITGKSRAHLQCNFKDLSEAEQEKLQIYIKQIEDEHKPLAYILGWVPFLDLTLQVSPPTLIPRLETEYWVADVIHMLTQHKKKDWTILDIGTGSGCIALSLAHAFPQTQVYALDIAPSALKLAHLNAEKNNIKNITFLESNLFSALPEQLNFDLIVSNPPYIDPAAQLEKSVSQWEDHTALFARNQGLYLIEQILEKSPAYLKKNELPYQLILEVDVSHADKVQQIAQEKRFELSIVQQDQFGRDRTVWIK